MDADIVERIHALVDNSMDDVYSASPPGMDAFSFSNCLSSMQFDTLFTSGLGLSNLGNAPEFHINTDNSGDDLDYASKKLINYEARVAVKILIPAVSVGPLIGKGGFFMRTLQHECYVNICPRELQYGGTTDRIVILKGRLGSVLNVTERITAHIKERCSKTKRADAFSLYGGGKAYEVRFVVPNSSADVLLSENVLHAINEESQCVVQLYPELLSLEDGTLLTERLILIAHDNPVNTRHGAQKILHSIAQDRHHASEIIKLDNQFPSRNNKRNSPIRYQNGQIKTDASFTFPVSPGNQPWNGTETTDQNKIKNYIENFTSILRAIHSPENAIQEAASAIKTLANWDVLELAVSVGMQNFGLMRASSPTPPISTGANHSYVLFLPEDQENLEVQGESVTVNRAVLEVLMNDTGALPDGTNYAESVIEEVAHPDNVQLKIPERIVGAVIGPKAKMLTDIQHFSRCRVQMERKDPASPPDGMRLLSLIGDSSAIKKCRWLMERLINEEYRRRVSRTVA